VCENSWGDSSNTLRHYLCGMFRGEYVKQHLHVSEVPMCLLVLQSVFLVGVYPVGVGIVCHTQFMFGFLALSLVGGVAVRCVSLRSSQRTRP
jgi:hypothetical protein